jgi:hypothetical protein
MSCESHNLHGEGKVLKLSGGAALLRGVQFCNLFKLQQFNAQLINATTIHHIVMIFFFLNIRRNVSALKADMHSGATNMLMSSRNLHSNLK